MLSAFFKPKSVAVVGASRDPEKLGYAVLNNLIEGGYPECGDLYPINPKADEILGYRTYKSVLDVDADIDLAVFAPPRELWVEYLTRSSDHSEIIGIYDADDMNNSVDISDDISEYDMKKILNKLDEELKERRDGR